MRNWLIAVTVSLAKGMTADPAAAERDCPKGLEPVGEFRLFFGLADTPGRMVTDEEWRRFLADIITPRFSAG